MYGAGQQGEYGMDEYLGWAYGQIGLDWAIGYSL